MLAEPEWMARKEKFPRMVEYYLMESIREGLSMHLLNETACIAIDFEKLKLQFQYALGNNTNNCNDLVVEIIFRQLQLSGLEFHGQI